VPQIVPVKIRNPNLLYRLREPMPPVLQRVACLGGLKDPASAVAKRWWTSFKATKAAAFNGMCNRSPFLLVGIFSMRPSQSTISQVRAY